ncbi:KinB-signaling pathway activation protein [Alicyclobacillus cycloheptanicus]|uniref:KinB signaling pathway activation protein n=1 Tax=Alicyclobacillus cycloheptanicus TaxID=1457 RepID=A0ABT9XL29_9BACL|nr:KinB-signaling pathway activation protein [Alicyclobacillus cycloheptanicus]MDQ0190441.1 KinB signaling pathway activation protein [Alicyclobacillus cycloheptanicus]WDM02680.1 KinB-signaling pathway activation protein [Alicyclobacillus cycloheptanicus]
MRLNAFIFFLTSTIVLGAIVGVATSALGIHLFWYTGIIEGGFLATTCLMGFWAYLTLNFIANMTLPKRVWKWAQALILCVVIYDMFWSRYKLDAARHPGTHISYWPFLIEGAWPLCAAVLAAIWKRKLSGKGSFLPTVFFLYVFTIIDWLLVIWHHSGAVVNQTGIVMMACNIYMILILGKLLSPIRERDAGLIATAEAKAAEKARVRAAKEARKAAKKRRKSEGSADPNGDPNFVE